MIEAFRKIWRFAGVERANINKSVVVKFLNAVFHMLEVSAIYFVIVALTQGNTGNDAAWTALAFMAVSIIGNAVTTAFSKNQQTHAGYFMAANERIKIGNLLKGVPMGFFNENSLGEVTGVCTTVLGNIEMLVPMVLVDIMGGLIGTVVFTAMILIFEWRVGLVACAGIFVYFLIVSSMEKKSAAIAPNAQKSQTALTSAVLEYVQGMGIVKSFNLSGRGDKRAQDALEFNRKSRDKTIIMIAHRLKTVRNADQILVVDEGRIVQKGKHEELIGQEGIYADFVLGRKEAIGWKLNA